eukprot:3642023-Pyramimonas_sp.AAC.1
MIGSMACSSGREADQKKMKTGVIAEAFVRARIHQVDSREGDEDAAGCRDRLRVGREVRGEVVGDLCGRGK